MIHIKILQPLKDLWTIKANYLQFLQFNLAQLELIGEFYLLIPDYSIFRSCLLLIRIISFKFLRDYSFISCFRISGGVDDGPLVQMMDWLDSDLKCFIIEFNFCLMNIRHLDQFTLLIILCFNLNLSFTYD